MKNRILGLAVLLIGSVAAMAQVRREYSVLEPPSIAVADFEVSMSAAEKEASKEHYGQLISQTLLTTLVQQNTSGQIQFADDSQWYRFAPFLKIYDKKYVERALSEGRYDPADLYSKSAGAFTFADLDYLVLGNVFEGVQGVDKQRRDAIGVSVRLLNTRRAEEVFAINYWVATDLSDLHSVCWSIGNLVIERLLKAHGGEFTARYSSGITAKAARLFYQPRLERAEDLTPVETDDSTKWGRDVEEETFYWVLPGEYFVTVYSPTGGIRIIPFTITRGGIEYVYIEQQHLEAPETGSITITGVFPANWYAFSVWEKQRQAKHWWETLDAAGQSGNREEYAFIVGNGQVYPLFPDSPVENISYRPDANAVVLDKRLLASYEIVVTALPYVAGSSDITGIQWVSMRKIVTSSPQAVNLMARKDVVIPIDEFKIREKQQVEAYARTRSTFLLNPAFATSVSLEIEDGVQRYGEVPLRSKEKVVIEGEYSQDEWDSMTVVRYTFRLRNVTIDGVLYPGLTRQMSLRKEDLDPARDAVLVVDFVEAARETLLDQRLAEEAKVAAVRPRTIASALGVGARAEEPATAPAPSGRLAPVWQRAPVQQPTSVASQAGAGVPSAEAPPAPARPRFLEVGAALGYSSGWYGGGLMVGGSLSLLRYLSSGFGLGVAASAVGVAGYGAVGGALLLQTAFGDLSKRRVAFLLDLGGAYWIMIRGGILITNAARTGGLTLRYGWHAMPGFNSSFLNVGWMFRVGR